MSLPIHAPSTARTTTLLLVVLSLLVACDGARVAQTAGPSVVPSRSPDATAVAEPTPITTDAVLLAGLPTACYGLGPEDCRRVAEHVATLLTPVDPRIVYLQVGPFGCPDGQRCPTTLTARPEGDVTAEFAGGAIGFRIKTTGDILEAARQEAFGIALPPTTRPPVPAAPERFSLGHCGLWSGIDLGGSWWDPVGFIDADHPDAINAADGTIAVIDPDHATFSSGGGLTVPLLRHAGEKFLPLCQ